jgi:16S rRNA (uracil1498-N3)-methyltransferase
MHRFFIAAHSWDGSKVILEGEQAHQILRVLRMSPGEHIIVLDNSGWEFEVELDEVKEKMVTGMLVEKRLCAAEPQTQLVLYQSLLKRENFEWVLQKCTEIGVSSFVPTLCERTIRHNEAGKLDRWGKIVREAAEQSGRGRLPTLSTPLRLSDALAQAEKCDLALIAWEEERNLSLGKAISEIAQPYTSITLGLFIGPEGGFSSQEVEKAVAFGIRPVSLGKRILRSETAAVAAATIALHALD